LSLSRIEIIKLGRIKPLKKLIFMEK